MSECETHEKFRLRQRSALFLMVLVTTIAAVLRIYELGTESIWLDEATSVVRAQTRLPKMVSYLASRDVHPPLYFAILHLWTRAFGMSESSVRSISVLAGILAVPVIFGLASRLFDPETGLFSALLLAISQFHIEFSQEARSNALLMLLTLFLMYSLIRALKTRRTRYFIANAVVGTLLAYTHYFGLLMIVVQNLYFLLGWNRHKRMLTQWILGQGSVVIVYVPWLWAILSQIAARSHQGVGLHAMPPTMGALVAIVRDFNGTTVSSWPFLEALMLLLTLLGVFTVGQRRGRFEWRHPLSSAESFMYVVSLKKLEHVLLLILWFLVPILLTFTFSHFISVLEIRSFIILLPAILMLAARGIRNIRPRSMQTLILLVLIFTNTYELLRSDQYGYFGVTNKEQWREVAQFVDTNAQPGDVVLFEAPYVQKPFDYYSQITDNVLPRQPGFLRGESKLNDTLENLLPLVAEHRRVWLISSHSRDTDGSIQKTLRESYIEVYQQQYVGIDLALFEVDGGED